MMADDVVISDKKTKWSDLIREEDYWSIWFGFIIIFGSLLMWIPKVPKVGKWTTDPLDAFLITSGETTTTIFLSLFILMAALGILTAIGIAAMRTNRFFEYLAGFCGVFVLATISYWIANQTNIKYLGLSYAMWALLLGLLISNTVGAPKWLKAGAKTEMFIKTGLVLLGAEVLFKKILSLGLPGLMVAWIVTPIVVIFMYRFGVKTLKMANKRLVIIIAAATSVCGVSAAIATAAACRAKKEDLTFAVGLTLIFTVLMMIFMPIIIKAIGMNDILGAAWMGGTIDSTGAVVAAGSMLGPTAEKVAAVVKMIQNVLIGLLAFFVAIYWVTVVERGEGDAKPNAMEIWYRFPKFVLGFVGASLLFSFVVLPMMHGDFKLVEVEFINPVTKILRGWFFCLAFTAIGLESNFRDLTSRMEGGKPLLLYVIGQSFNLVLTLFIAWLAFMVLFPHAVQ
ncbi:putative sulfate exporter family transporter [bacterium]|nr:putative sulfate exporter family transporter [bacterium]